MKGIMNYQIITNEAAMLELGAKFAGACKGGAVFFLQGQLGAGKTTFARGILRGLGYEGKVKSPTYTLVEPYELSLGFIYHFDLYRLRDPRELEFIGVQDYFLPQHVCLIEWPEYGEGVLPQADVSFHFNIEGDHRLIKWEAYTPRGILIIEQMQHEK